jgi:hypothetical protein
VDASILITANVPSAKKIIVHGPTPPDEGAIPSQFPISEDIQFCQLQQEALDFFGIDEQKAQEYFLVDQKTRKIHNPFHFVRDFYFFKRSQYPQLCLVHKEPEVAHRELQEQCMSLKFGEIGKVMLVWGILKNVSQVVQRVVFLHEDLVKLPSFPRKALEAELDLFEGGSIGRELQGVDVLHKFTWIRLIARMFEAMAANFNRPEEIQLLLNVINGSLALHAGDACILRYSMAAIINATHQFKNIFNSTGYLLIMPSLVQIYSNNLSNLLMSSSIEFLVKQLYILHRKPFLLQMFGSIANSLELEDHVKTEGQRASTQTPRATEHARTCSDPFRIQPGGLYQLLLSLSRPSRDLLHVMELVKMKRPISSLDFCYSGEAETVSVQECISICAMVTAYDNGTVRANEMLTVLDAVMPLFLRSIVMDKKSEVKEVREVIQQLSNTMKTILHNSDKLTQLYAGPTRSEELRSTSQYYASRAPYSPVIEIDDDSHSKFIPDGNRSKPHPEDGEDSEMKREHFRYPRSCLLNFSSDFLTKCSIKLNEINKKSAHEKNLELLDQKCFIKLNEVASSMIKLAPYDQDTMQSRGLHNYMTNVLPNTDWSQPIMKPILISFLRRLEKMMLKIHKNHRIYVAVDWASVATLLLGVYETIWRFPHVIVSMPGFKSLMATCQQLALGEEPGTDPASSSYSRKAALPSQEFCDVVFLLITLQVLTLGDAWSFEQRIGLAESFGSGSLAGLQKEKGEVTLLNLVLPLILHIGSGRRDVPKLRKTDVLYSLNLLLGLVTGREGAPGTARGKEGVPNSVRVGFLGLRILFTCYPANLSNEWHRIARTIRAYGATNDANIALWKLLDYVSVHRTPLYNLLLPFIRTRVKVSPEPGGPEPAEGRQNKAQLMTSLRAELAELRQDVVRRRRDQLEAPPPASRKTTESGRTRASFVEYVSEVWPHSSSRNTALLTGSSSSTLGGVAR